MKETWRWYGTLDQIKLSEVRQTGAAGIVTALHEILMAKCGNEPRSPKDAIRSGLQDLNGMWWKACHCTKISNGAPGILRRFLPTTGSPWRIWPPRVSIPFATTSCRCWIGHALS